MRSDDSPLTPPPSSERTLGIPDIPEFKLRESELGCLLSEAGASFREMKWAGDSLDSLFLGQARFC